MDGAQQSALRPWRSRGRGPFDDAQYVLPGHVGPQAADMGHPILCCLLQPFHVAVLPCQSHLALRRRIPAQRPGLPPTRHLVFAFAVLGSLELGRVVQDLESEVTLRDDVSIRSVSDQNKEIFASSLSIAAKRCDIDRIWFRSLASHPLLLMKTGYGGDQPVRVLSRPIALSRVSTDAAWPGQQKPTFGMCRRFIRKEVRAPSLERGAGKPAKPALPRANGA